MSVKLYGYWRSSATYRVRIALHLKGISYEYEPINLVADGGRQHSPDYVLRNPEARVPMLEVNGHRISQSIAILELLEELYPQVPLLPVQPFERAHVRSLAQLLAADTQPLQNGGVRRYLAASMHATDEEVREWVRNWVTRGFDIFEKRASSVASFSTFSYGRQPTLADVCLIPQLYAARFFGIDIGSYRRIGEIEALCIELAGFRDAAPERQPDAV